MNPSNASSGPTSARTSPGARKTPESAGKNFGESEKLTESEFLQEQADAARAAIANAFSDLKTDLAKGADPRLWLKSHPWIALSSAAVAGFAAAATVVPSKEQQELRKLEAVERALHRARNPEPAPSGNGDAPTKNHRGFVAMILHEVMQAVKPALIALITSHFTPPPEPHDGREDREAGQK